MPAHASIRLEAITLTGDFGTPVQLITAFEFQLLSYPGGRFSPRDEDERARYGAYAPCTAALRKRPR